MKSYLNWQFERRIRRLNNDYVRCTRCDGDGWSSRLGSECPWCSQGWVKKKKGYMWLWLLLLAALIAALILTARLQNKAPAGHSANRSLFLLYGLNFLYFVHFYWCAPKAKVFDDSVLNGLTEVLGNCRSVVYEEFKLWGVRVYLRESKYFGEFLVFEALWGVELHPFG